MRDSFGIDRRTFLRQSAVVLAAASVTRPNFRVETTRLADVNRTDLDDAIRLARHPMSSVFNADDNGIPYFGCLMRPTAAFNVSWPAESFIPAGHLFGLLNAAAILGEAPEPDVFAT